MAGPDYSQWATQSSPYDDAISQAEQKYNLPAGMLRKQLIVESGLNPKAVSAVPGSHATGIAQFQPATAASVGLADPTDAGASINAAARVDAANYARFGNWGKALLAYHDGAHAVAEGRVSPAAMQYRQNIVSVPDYQTPTAVSGAPPANPEADFDTAHASPTPTHPEAAFDQAHAETAPTETPEQRGVLTPQEVEARAGQAARNAYDASDFPTRTAISAGQALEDLYHGAQGVGADIAQGIGQLTGSNALTSAAQNERQALAAQEAAAESARQGEHGASNVLGQTLPYLASGPIGPEEAAANVLTRLGGAAARGGIGNAVIGAAQPTGAATAAQDLAARGRNALTQGAAGAVLGPTAEALGTAAGATGKYVSNKLTGLLGGAESTAASHLASVAPDQGALDLSAADKIPGYTPSAAEASSDPRLAELDRQLRRNSDAYKANAEATDQANNQAIQNAVQSIRGDRTTLAKLYADRAQQTGPLYEQAAQAAAAQGARVDATPVWTALQNALHTKQGETSVTNVLGQYAKLGSLYDRVDPMTGKPVITSNVQRLTNIRNQMSTDIGKQFATDSAGNDMKAAARPLMAVRDVIDQQLAKANPALAQAREKFAEMSAPINQQEALQARLPPEKDASQFTPGRMAAVLQQLADARASSGADPAKALTNDQMQQLSEVHDVLQHRANMSKAAPGADVKQQVKNVVNNVSDTGSWNPLLMAQHAGTAGGAAAGATASFLGLGHVHPGLTTALTAGGAMLGNRLGTTLARSAEQNPGAVREALQNFLLDPAHHPVPNVAPSSYTRSVAGQQAAEAVARGASNALTQGQRP
jgi:hypothetical protein